MRYINSLLTLTLTLTLATKDADFGDCCQIRRQLPLSATVGVFGDCRRIRRQIDALSGDYSRRIRVASVDRA